MRLFIAEKPGVGLAIAQLVGATNRTVGAWVGPDVMVSWTLGHLVGIAPPQQLGFNDDWSADHLPLFPLNMTLSLLPGTACKAQFAVLKKLIQQASRIVCATDAGREGELIFRYIYQLAEGTAPCDRLWISSLTPEAIAAGLANLKPLSTYDGLYLAAKSRAEADWLVGINLTRAMTVQHRHLNKIIRVGRLQSPALTLVAERYAVHTDFKPRLVYRPIVTLASPSQPTPTPTRPFTAAYSQPCTSAQQADAVLAQHLATGLLVLSTQQKNVTKQPPTLLYLTLAQRLANDHYGYSAAHTLTCLQHLYEGGYITYPRTDSAYLTDELREPVRTLLIKLSADFPLRQTVARQPGNRPFQADKVTDHPALLPTLHGPALAVLSEGERNLYELVVERFFQAFGAPRQEQHTQLLLGTAPGQTIESGCYVATSTLVLDPGYSALESQPVAEAPPLEAAHNRQPLPLLAPLTPVKVLDQTCRRATTTAPPLLTESSLLALLESGGQPTQTHEEEPLEPGLATFSLGTPATRADIIESLLRSHYIERRQKALVPTPFGQSVWQLLRELPVGQPVTTGKWEYALRKIEQQQLDPAEFSRHLRQMITQSVLATHATVNRPVQTGDELPCPACKKGFLAQKNTFFTCSAYTEGCQFTLPAQLLGRPITPYILRAILQTGLSPLINGFTGKKGPFDARIELAPGVTGTLGLSFVFAKK